jgi:hypothetical protein
MVGKENQMHHYATVGRGSQDYKEQIPGGLSQQTMMGPTKVELYTVFILAAWPVLVLIYHILVLVGWYFGRYF